MGVNTGVKYIGKEAVYQDNILRTGLVWEPGETHSLPVTMAKEFLKHPSVFQEVPGFEYVSATSSGLQQALQAPVNAFQTAVILGDSITQENFEQFATHITQRPLWWHWANALMGQRLVLLNNAGVSGEALASIYARIDKGTYGVGFRANGTAGVSAATAPGVIPFQPAFCFVHAGINDLLAGKSDTYITEYLGKIYSALLSAGIRVVAMTIMPARLTQPGYSAATVGVQHAVNAWIRNVATSTPGMILVDAWAAMVDPTDASGQAYNAYLRDNNMHPNNVSGYLVGKEIARVLSPIIPDTRRVLPAANIDVTLDASINQILPNPLLTGSVAVSGTGWTGNGPNTSGIAYVRGGSATAAASVESRSDGKGQNLVIDATFTSASDSLEVRFPSLHAKVTAGKSYIAVAEVSAAGAADAALTASANALTPNLNLQLNDGTTNRFRNAFSSQGTDVAMIESHSVVLMTPVFTIPDGVTPTVFRPNVSMSAKGAGSARFRIGRVALFGLL